MKVRCIIAQRTCRYPGEYAPELLDAWSEWTLEENPEGYNEKLRGYEAYVGTEFDAVRELDITIPDPVINKLFITPEAQAIIGGLMNPEQTCP